MKLYLSHRYLQINVDSICFFSELGLVLLNNFPFHPLSPFPTKSFLLHDEKFSLQKLDQPYLSRVYLSG